MTDAPESAAAALELPDPARLNEVEALTPEQWADRRRILLELFREHIYGEPPAVAQAITCDLRERDADACEGRATRYQVDIVLCGGALRLGALIFVPNDIAGPVPAFAGLNFHGNHTVDPDPRIALPQAWVAASRAEMGTHTNTACEVSRGLAAGRWPVERVTGRGYAVATLYAGQIDPDFDDGFTNGIHALEREPRGPGSGGTIAAWAWGLSRLREATATIEGIDPSRIMAIGHSRMGKAALWAAAEDRRFAGAVSNGSGCLGAALSRRCMGERIADITTRFPHWFCGRCAEYADREHEIPIDQHLLLGLIAPRPLYIASAEQDHWADPEGEFHACVHATAIYRKLGRTGLGLAPSHDAALPGLPPLNSSIGHEIGYHIRPGHHDITPLDWWHVLNFADRQLKLSGQ